MTGETRILLSLISRREHIVNLPHDPVGPLNHSRDHRLCPMARPVGEDFSGLEMPSDQNPPCRARELGPQQDMFSRAQGIGQADADSAERSILQA